MKPSALDKRNWPRWALRYNTSDPTTFVPNPHLITLRAGVERHAPRNSNAKEARADYYPMRLLFLNLDYQPVSRYHCTLERFSAIFDPKRGINWLLHHADSITLDELPQCWYIQVSVMYDNGYLHCRDYDELLFRANEHSEWEPARNGPERSSGYQHNPREYKYRGNN